MPTSRVSIAGQTARAISATALIFATIACSASPAISPSANPPSPTPPAPSGEPSPVTSPSAAPSGPVKPSPSARPVDPVVATWSKPQTVGPPGQCQELSVVIDSAGGRHIAAACDARIHYSVQAGRDWNTTEFKPPAKRDEYDPQLAFDGGLLYLAYTRIAVEEGGCGDSGLRDVGVFYRTRSLPDGAWSEPRQLGAVADHIQSFRVVDGTIHATVSNEADDQTYYETLEGTALKRHEIPKATGDVALRIGDDGRARVAYEADGALWYGTFTGADLATKKIPGSDNGYGPVLVLGAASEPYLLWHRGYHGAGCTYPDPGPKDGTYLSTLVDNSWHSEHVSTREGAMSLTLDVKAERVHALIDAPDGMTHISRIGGESWAKKALFDRHTSSAVIRLDPRTGALLVAYVAFDGDATHVDVVTYGANP